MLIATVAVADSDYSFDKPFSYVVPDDLADKAATGVRVRVPFSKNNHLSDGVILDVLRSGDTEGLKSVHSVLDAAPMYTKEQIALAVFMRNRYFCTLFDALRVMLPTGFWFNLKGERRIKDKNIKCVELNTDPDEALSIADGKKNKAHLQSAVLELLATFGQLPVKDIQEITGATGATLNALAKAELIKFVYAGQFDTFKNEKVVCGLPPLSDEQREVFAGLKEKTGSGFSVNLVHGVTGSGKTMVYLHLIMDSFLSGKCAVLLVPEISLTPQMIAFFSRYFGNNIAVLHSGLSASERCTEWKKIKSGLARVVIGTRSAVFAPVTDLGLMIIDEENDDSYRSENNPRYSAREIGEYICYKKGVPLILGSATPDLTTRYKAQRGDYGYFRLSDRYNRLSLPEVMTVDLRDDMASGNMSDISFTLRDEIEKNLQNGEQSLVFINRRGSHKLVTCPDCGFIYKCPNCSISLTHHANNNRLICHYCGYTRRLDSRCPDCGGELGFFGSGTQRIAEELSELFPDTEILRADTDTLYEYGSHDKLFGTFIDEKIPIMVGTQMISKGLNFENVTLVGIISADQSLYAGDYKAEERCFSLLTQIIGRSGRAKVPGRAVIQTFTPDNPVIRFASAQDYDSFYEHEISFRKLQGSPPFSEIFSLTVSGLSEDAVLKAVAYLRSYLINKKSIPDLRVLGPSPMPVYRLNRRYRHRLYLYTNRASELRKLLSDVLIYCRSESLFKGVSVYAEQNPSD